jgi:hypothetical protein
VVVGEEPCETVSGAAVRRLGRLKYLSLGEFTPPGVLAVEGKDNLLGLRFWSRFVVTFDFPHDKVYLKRGKNFERPDTHDVWGMRLCRKDGKVMVDSVDKGSAAEGAGLKPGDVLVRVGDAKAEGMSLFQRRKCFCTEDTRLRLTVRRGDKEMAIVLALGREQAGRK